MNFKLTQYQNDIVAAPEACNIFLPGGRGSGKSYGMLGMALQHAELYGEHARIAYIRRHRPDCRDFESAARSIFWQAYGDAATYNSQTGLWRLPNGATLEIGNLETETDLNRWTGRSFTLVLLDEVQQHVTPVLVDRLRACLRSGSGVPVRMVLAANPSGAGHTWLVRRFGKAVPRRPFQDDSGNWWISFPGTYLDNDSLHHESYERELRAAVAGDHNLARAWIEGRWDILAGSYFGDCFEPARSVVDSTKFSPEWMEIGQRAKRDPFRPRRETMGAWSTWLALDHGDGAAPTVALLLAKVPSGGRYGPDNKHYPSGSIFALDETNICDPTDPSRGVGQTVDYTAGRVMDMCAQWGVPPSGVADDACWNASGSQEGSIGKQYEKAGLRLRKARKGSRQAGWSLLRTLMDGAGKAGNKGLYISDRCSILLETLPLAPRDKRKPYDVDTNCNDHSLDALRYGCLNDGDGGAAAFSTVPYFGM